MTGHEPAPPSTDVIPGRESGWVASAMPTRTAAAPVCVTSTRETTNGMAMGRTTVSVSGAMGGSGSATASG
jgi:hypothetical protein